MSIHGSECLMSVLCTPLQVKCYLYGLSLYSLRSVLDHFWIYALFQMLLFYKTLFSESKMHLEKQIKLNISAQSCSAFRLARLVTHFSSV